MAYILLTAGSDPQYGCLLTTASCIVKFATNTSDYCKLILTVSKDGNETGQWSSTRPNVRPSPSQRKWSRWREGEYKVHIQVLITVPSARYLGVHLTATCRGTTMSTSRQRKPQRPWTLSGGTFQLVQATSVNAVTTR